MSIIYVTAGGWGAGNGGVPLPAATVDANFYTVAQAITALQALPLGVGISTITQTAPNQITITLTDARVYTFTIPTLALNFRGEWTPGTYYSPYDIVSVAATLAVYNVLVGHISAATFDPNANDGAGHSYYALLFAVPNPLPAGGATGAALIKLSTANYDTGWGPVMPRGGASGTALIKNSLVDWDFVLRQVNFADLAGAPTPAQLRTTVNNVLAPAGGVAVLDPSVGNVFSFATTPVADVVINAASAPVDARPVVFVNDGGTSFHLSFGTSFKSAGVLTLPGTSAGRYAVSFVGDGSVLTELSRSGPI